MKNSNLPKISIVTPSYNQGDFIEETIKSVINQNYPNLEYIIIDGGSTDNTINIIEKYESYLNFWVSEKDEGQSDAINKGFLKATGDIFYWINSDDYLLPNILHEIANLNWREGIGAFVGIGHKIDVKGEIKYTPQFYAPITTESLFRWTSNKNFMQPACFFSKKAWETCGPLNKDLYFCMDVDLWIKISKEFKIKRISTDIAHAYIHEDAKTTAEVEKMKMETYLMIASHGGLPDSRNQLFDFYRSEVEKIVKRNNLSKYKFSTIIKYIMRKTLVKLKLLKK